MPEHRRRLDRVLEPAYLEQLDARSLDELRAMRGECEEIETELSYVRRLAHARMEILRAERDRRASGASVSELVASLPRILAGSAPPPVAGDQPAARIGSGRMVPALAPSPEIKWRRGLERLIADDSLATLPDLADDEVAGALDDLGTLEHEVSETRRRLHHVIDALHAEIAGRLSAGAT